MNEIQVYYTLFPSPIHFRPTTLTLGTGLSQSITQLEYSLPVQCDYHHAAIDRENKQQMTIVYFLHRILFQYQ